jgi:hypothetical protein
MMSIASPVSLIIVRPVGRVQLAAARRRQESKVAESTLVFESGRFCRFLARWGSGRKRGQLIPRRRLAAASEIITYVRICVDG